MEHTILVVEDEPLQLESLARFLSKQGYRVVKAGRSARDCEGKRH
jgi:two-component system NtrC family response regulator